MKHIFLLITITLFISCGKDKVVLLPEISHSEISEIQDVSAAYIFYDETQPDSTELNRKNLISTTNWLVNVDKRLTLRQAIPYIQFLQNKKLSSSHKNPNAKNYFTCHDLSKNNLGFLEFTKINYEILNINKNSKYILPLNSKEEYRWDAGMHALSTLAIVINRDKSINFGDEVIDINQFQEKLSFFLKEYNFLGFFIKIYFNKDLKFQDYISMKFELINLQSDLIILENREFIIN